MASELNLPDGSKINVDWATDETLKDVLAVLSNKTPASKKKAKEEVEATKKTGRLGDAMTKTKTKMSKLGKSSENVAKQFDGVEATASSMTSKLLAVVGGLGAFGAAAGYAAGVLDSFIDAQVLAIQSGFSFSDQLIESRQALADIGLNFTQFSTILAEQGESLRQLGGTGQEAASVFSDMVMSARSATENMGYYGLTSEEIAGEMADLTGILVKAGNIGDNLFSDAVSSFALLNREVLGYARLTGRQRREIMRNDSAVDADSLFLSTVSSLGGEATASALTMVRGLTATFGDASPQIIEAIKKSVLTFTSGMEQRSPELLQMLEISGLRGMIDNYARNFVTSAGDAETFAVTNRQFLGNISSYLQATESETRDKLNMFSAGNGSPLAEQYQMLMDLTVQSRTAAEGLSDTTTMTEAFTGGLEQTTKRLLGFKAQLEVFINEVRAGVLALFGVEDFSALTDINLAEIGRDLHNTIQDILAWKESVFGEDGIGVTTLIAAIAGLFIAPTVISALAAAVTGLFAMQALRAIPPVSPSSPVSPRIPGANYFGKILKLAGRAAPFISGGLGIVDEGYNDAGYGIADRAAFGIAEGVAEISDLTANITSWALKGMFDVGNGWDNDIDVSQSLHDWITSDSGKSWLLPNYESPQSIGPTGGAPLNYNFQQQSGMLMPYSGQNNGSSEDVINYLNSINASQSSNNDETNRLLRKLIDATENQ